ncbi:hypothetical protein H0H92_008918 [Tricholoma furcatifolium]|nr:hypothetical protein H0H92_008918 [Tricholoma furcatifolium]
MSQNPNPPTTGEVSDLVALIIQAAKIIESHYSSSIPSLNDLSSHPIDSTPSPPELRNAVQLLEGACAQLSATVARPAHVVLNIFEHGCLGVVTTFKIPDILLEKPSGMNIAEIVSVDCFANNRLSLELLSSNPLSDLVSTLTTTPMGNSATILSDFLGDAEWADSQATERSPWNRMTGREEALFKYYETPEGKPHGARFGMGMRGWNNAIQANVSLVEGTEFPWENYPPGTTICDVGSGIGSVAMDLMKAYPNLQFKLQDLPAVIQQAETIVWPRDYPTAIAERRVEFKSMDFLVESPIEGCDVYYLKNILHNWPDKESLLILQNIRSIVKPGGRVLIHDYVVQHANRMGMNFPEAPEPMLPNFGLGRIRQYNIDILMMILFNSMERTLKEFVDMSEKAGLKFVKLWHVGEMAIIELEPGDERQ